MVTLSGNKILEQTLLTLLKGMQTDHNIEMLGIMDIMAKIGIQEEVIIQLITIIGMGETADMDIEI